MAQANIQDKLKTIAVFSMLIDHIGFYFFPTIEIFRVIGRLAMPIFCFFAGYNFKGKKKSILLKYGFLLSIMAFLGTASLATLNILFTFYLGQLYLQKIYTLTQDFLSNMFQILPLILLTPATFLIFDYGTLAITIMALGYMYKNTKYHHKKYLFIIAILVALYSQVIFWFDLHNFILLIIISIMLFYLLSRFSYYEAIVDSKIAYTISRNSLFIYFVSTGVFEILNMLFIIIKDIKILNLNT